MGKGAFRPGHRPAESERRGGRRASAVRRRPVPRGIGARRRVSLRADRGRGHGAAGRFGSSPKEKSPAVRSRGAASEQSGRCRRPCSKQKKKPLPRCAGTGECVVAMSASNVAKLTPGYALPQCNNHVKRRLHAGCHPAWGSPPRRSGSPSTARSGGTVGSSEPSTPRCCRAPPRRRRDGRRSARASGNRRAETRTTERQP